MPAVDDMRALTREILQAQRNRVEAISGLRGGMSSMLADFESARRATSKGQRSILAGAKSANQATVIRTLSGFQAARKGVSRQLHSGLRRGNADRKAAVGDMLAELNRSKDVMARSLRVSLTQEASARCSMMRTALADFGKSRQVLAGRLHANLSREFSQRKHIVATMLGQFDASHQAMSRTLRKDLAQGSASRADAVRTMRKDFLGEQSRVRQQREAVRDEWRTLRSAIHPASAGTPLEVVEQFIPVPEYTPASGATVVEPTVVESRDFAALHDRVFEYLADRPDGSRLVEIEEAMGVSRFQMSRILRSLMDDNMVEKRDLLYFAI